MDSHPTANFDITLRADLPIPSTHIRSARKNKSIKAVIGGCGATVGCVLHQCVENANALDAFKSGRFCGEFGVNASAAREYYRLLRRQDTVIIVFDVILARSSVLEHPSNL